MVIAELHNKLSGNGAGLTDRSEDLLTSNVFGLLRYLPATAVLLPWLRMSKPHVAGARPLIAADATEARLEFWPRVREREMDLCLVASGPSGQEVVGIECKLESGASDAEARPALPERSVLRKRGNQLADYWDGILHDEVTPAIWSPFEAPPKALLYLTADFACPTEAFEKALAHVRLEARNEAARAFHWTNWHSLPEVLRAYLTQETDAYRKQVAHDLLRLLERKNLVRFGGFTQVPSASSKVVFWHHFTQPIAATRAPHFYGETS